MKEEWLFPGAIVSVDVETTSALVAEIKRLIDVVGGMALAQPEQEQEPVAWVCMNGEKHDIDFDQPEIDAIPVGTFLYTTPPQRPWQGLTDEDWEKVANRKNTVLDTFEQGATWAAYKLERLNK